MSGIKEVVAVNLDYEISSQNKDGSWTPTWTWGGAYPDDWKMAQREWSGIITLDKLLLLKKFGRIEGVAQQAHAADGAAAPPLMHNVSPQKR
jgi:hypothetical protein